MEKQLCCVLHYFNHVQFFAIPWTITRQAPVHGILQTRILEWVAISFSRDPPDPGIEPASLCLLYWQAGSLPLPPPGKPEKQQEDQMKTQRGEGKLGKESKMT